VPPWVAFSSATPWRSFTIGRSVTFPLSLSSTLLRTRSPFKQQVFPPFTRPTAPYTRKTPRFRCIPPHAKTVPSLLTRICYLVQRAFPSLTPTNCAPSNFLTERRGALVVNPGFSLSFVSPLFFPPFLEWRHPKRSLPLWRGFSFLSLAG